MTAAVSPKSEIIHEVEQITSLYDNMVFIKRCIDDNPQLGSKAFTEFATRVAHYPSEEAVGHDPDREYQFKLDFIMSFLVAPRKFRFATNSEHGVVLEINHDRREMPQMHEAFHHVGRTMNPMLRTLYMAMPRNSSYFQTDLMIYSIPYRTMRMTEAINTFMSDICSSPNVEGALDHAFRGHVLNNDYDESVRELLADSGIDLANQDFVNPESVSKLVTFLETQSRERAMVYSTHKNKVVLEQFLLPVLKSGHQVRVIPLALILGDLYYNPNRSLNVAVQDLLGVKDGHDPRPFLELGGWEQTFVSLLASKYASDGLAARELASPVRIDSYHEGMVRFGVIGNKFTSREIELLKTMFVVSKDKETELCIMYPKVLKRSNQSLFGIYSKLVSTIETADVKLRRDLPPVPNPSYTLGDRSLKLRDLDEATRNYGDMKSIVSKIMAKAVGPKRVFSDEEDPELLPKIAESIIVATGLSRGRGRVCDRDMCIVYNVPENQSSVISSFIEDTPDQAVTKLLSQVIDDAVKWSKSRYSLAGREIASVRVADTSLYDSFDLEKLLHGGSIEFTAGEDPEIYDKYHFLVVHGGTVSDYAQIVPNHVLCELQIASKLYDVMHDEEVAGALSADIKGFINDIEPTKGDKVETQYNAIVNPQCQQGAIGQPAPNLDPDIARWLRFIRVFDTLLKHNTVRELNMHMKNTFTQIAMSINKKCGISKTIVKGLKTMIENWTGVLKTLIINAAAQRAGISDLVKNKIDSAFLDRYFKENVVGKYWDIVGLTDSNQLSDDPAVAEVRRLLLANPDTLQGDQLAYAKNLLNDLSYDNTTWRQELAKAKILLCGNNGPDLINFPVQVAQAQARCDYDEIRHLVPFMAPFSENILNMHITQRRFIHQNQIDEYFLSMDERKFAVSCDKRADDDTINNEILTLVGNSICELSITIGNTCTGAACTVTMPLYSMIYAMIGLTRLDCPNDPDIMRLKNKLLDLLNTISLNRSQRTFCDINDPDWCLTLADVSRNAKKFVEILTDAGKIDARKLNGFNKNSIKSLLTWRDGPIDEIVVLKKLKSIFNTFTRVLSVGGTTLTIDLASEGLGGAYNGAGVHPNRDVFNKLSNPHIDIALKLLYAYLNEGGGKYNIANLKDKIKNSSFTDAQKLVINVRAKNILPITDIEADGFEIINILIEFCNLMMTCTNPPGPCP